MAPTLTEHKSLCELFQRVAAAQGDRPALRTPGGAVEITWAEYADRVRNIAAGLAALGVGRGDTVGFMLTNRPAFHLCDSAAMHLGATPFSVYNTSAPEQITYILDNAETNVVLCETAFLDRLRAAAGGAVEHFVCVDGDPAPVGAISLKQLECLGRPDFDFDAAWQAVGPGDVLTLIYTSGTTGPPKGVELTHSSVLAMFDALAEVVTARPDDRVLSYLPSAHLADRAFSHYQSIASGLCLTSLDVTGAAPSSLVVLEFFAGIGLPIAEIWGMSEIGVATGNLPGRERFGTVGVALRGYELRLADDGELLARGPTLMKGYRRDPERTAEALDAEGWMHTGDVATIEQIKRYEILPVDWEPAGDELTPTSKLKRKPIAAKYADVIDALYAD